MVILRSGIAGILAALSIAAGAEAATFNTLTGEAPVVIAHAGASAYLPPHTLAGYELAAKMGADYIEPDLQITKDGHLVAMHDLTLDRTTNAVELWGQREGGHLVSDYSLAEIRQLTVKPVGPLGGTEYPGFTPSMDNPLSVPTFDEVLDWLAGYNTQNGTKIGVYPESKVPHRPEMNDRIVSTLKSKGFTDAEDRVVLQTFSTVTAQSMAAAFQEQGITAEITQLGVALIFNGQFGIGVADESATSGPLIGYNILGLSQVAAYADILGLNIARASEVPAGIPGLDQLPGGLTADYLAAAHAAGLKVHMWTFTHLDEADAFTRIQPYLELGIDGLFTDNPDFGRTVVDANIAPVPVPAALPLLGAALAALGLFGRRSRKHHRGLFGVPTTA